MIFDTHAHYDDEAFNEDREALLDSLVKGNVTKVVNIGANLAGSRASVELADRYDFIYAAIGVHPDDAAQINDEGIAILRELSRNEKVKAVGEIGLDYYWNKENADIQKEAFARQIELARDLKLPIVIHSREAAKDTLDIMKEYKASDVGGVMHCFSYSPEIAKEVVDMGFYIGVGGVVTFKNAKKLRETVEIIPLEKIVLETDSPYLAPDPFRGKRNCSLYLEFVVKMISQIKNVATETVEEVTYNNALEMYGIR